MPNTKQHRFLFRYSPLKAFHPWGPEMVLLLSCKKKKFHGLFSSDFVCLVVYQLLMGCRTIRRIEQICIVCSKTSLPSYPFLDKFFIFSHLFSIHFLPCDFSTPPPIHKGASFQIPDISCFDFTLIFSSTDLDLDLEAEEDLLELCTFSAGGGAGAGAGAGASGVSGAEAPVLSGAVAGGMNGLLGGGALEVVVCGMGGGCAGAGKRGTGGTCANLVGGFNPSEKY